MKRRHAGLRVAFGLGLGLFAHAAQAQAQAQGAVPDPATQQNAPDAGVPLDEVKRLPAQHVPRLDFQLAPAEGAKVGEAIKLTITADALEGDDVTVPEQSFEPFELIEEDTYTRPAKDGRQTFVFVLELLALESGPVQIPALELRVVTSNGLVGTTQLDPIAFAVGSHLANEPNAEPKPATKPVVVMQDDYTLLYVLGGLLAAALVALITWLVMRWWQRREKPDPPPPPPRPPWDIAVEKLAELRKRKSAMIEAGKGAQFVDEASDVVREYLGGHFGFDGLETTTHEMLRQLARHRAAAGLTDEVGHYLRRCDLVKFAKVEPDRDEVDLILAKAQDIVQFHGPGQAPEQKPEQEPEQKPGQGQAPATQPEGDDGTAGGEP